MLTPCLLRAFSLPWYELSSAPTVSLSAISLTLSFHRAQRTRASRPRLTLTSPRAVSMLVSSRDTGRSDEADRASDRQEGGVHRELSFDGATHSDLTRRAKGDQGYRPSAGRRRSRPDRRRRFDLPRAAVSSGDPEGYLRDPGRHHRRRRTAGHHRSPRMRGGDRPPPEATDQALYLLFSRRILHRVDST